MIEYVAPAGPIGFVESPREAFAKASNAVRIDGWALDMGVLTRVSIERDPRPGDLRAHINERGRVHIGDVRIRTGSRPDLKNSFPNYPNHHNSAWDFELRREAIAKHPSFNTTIHVVAHNDKGQTTVLGSRRVEFGLTDSSPPYIFCNRPFDSVFILPSGEVNPYPDCRPDEAFGSLSDPDANFEEIWFGERFMQLRNRIIHRDPPAMCLTCAHFINRNVNELDYFQTR